jgi:hypothetical protein
MAVALKVLFNKRQLTLARAKLRAWWEGEAYDEAAALAAFEAKLLAANENGDADDALFDELPFDWPSRLMALAVLWGQDRVRPGDEADEALEPARLELPPGGVLALLGPGLAAPVAALARAHPGKIEAFEWREETLEGLKYGVRKAGLDSRVAVTRIDLEAHVFAANTYDGLLSLDDFAYCGYPPHLAQQIMKCLKPGARAVVEAYVGLRSPELTSAFASSFAEPQVRAHGDLLQFFNDAGLAIEADEDLTEEFSARARLGFKQLGENLQADEMEVLAARELAWEVETWRVRLKLLAQRRLERRRFVLRKPVVDEPPAIEEAPIAPAKAAAPARPPGEDNVMETMRKLVDEHKRGG